MHAHCTALETVLANHACECSCSSRLYSYRVAPITNVILLTMGWKNCTSIKLNQCFATNNRGQLFYLFTTRNAQKIHGTKEARFCCCCWCNSWLAIQISARHRWRHVGTAGVRNLTAKDGLGLALRILAALASVSTPGHAYLLLRIRSECTLLALVVRAGHGGSPYHDARDTSWRDCICWLRCDTCNSICGIYLMHTQWERNKDACKDADIPAYDALFLYFWNFAKGYHK